MGKGGNDDRNGSFLAIKMKIHEFFFFHDSTSWTWKKKLNGAGGYAQIFYCYVNIHVVYLLLLLYCGALISKNTVQALKHPSADVVNLNVHKSDTTAYNKLCQ